MTSEDTRTEAERAFQRASHRQIHGTGAIRRLSTKELREFVVDYVAGQIFTSSHIDKPSMSPLVFLPLGFGVLSTWERADIEQIGIIYERIDKAGPRAINGMPMFFSMRIMHKDDWERCGAADAAGSGRQLERKRAGRYCRSLLGGATRGPRREVPHEDACRGVERPYGRRVGRGPSGMHRAHPCEAPPARAL
jgi:hypothetical protein